MLVIGAEVMEAIRRHAEGGYPEEICGGLLGSVAGDGSIEIVEAAPIDNIRDDERGRRYLIGANDVLRLEKRAEAAGSQVVGYYHSHPDAPAVPSEFDREHAWPWYTYLIVSVVDGAAREARGWRLADDRQRFLSIALVDDERAELKVEVEEE